jgi:hypothetical protein
VLVSSEKYRTPTFLIHSSTVVWAWSSVIYYQLCIYKECKTNKVLNFD